MELQRKNILNNFNRLPETKKTGEYEKISVNKILL